jgi:hypothetical protein
MIQFSDGASPCLSPWRYGFYYGRWCKETMTLTVHHTFVYNAKHKNQQQKPMHDKHLNFIIQLIIHLSLMNSDYTSITTITSFTPLANIC